MPTISTFYGVVVQMFWRDHNPPHFPASYRGDEVLIEIETLAVIEGSLPRCALAMVLEWAGAHQAETVGGLGPMPAETKAEVDRAPVLMTSGSPWRVASVEALPGWRLRVRFNDGLEGVVDMEREVHALDAGVFAELADPDRFAAVYVDFGAVTWPGEIDLAPDAMHAEIEANGRWVL